MLLGSLRGSRLGYAQMAMVGRNISNTIRGKVAVLGAAGGIGQPLSLLLKELGSSITQLALYDIANMGMAVDIAHISTAPQVMGYSGESQLETCLSGAQVVVIPAGIPRKPGMTRDDLFNVNASIVHKLTKACASVCPEAHVLIITNPVNSTVPIARETLLACGIQNPKVYGITTLDSVRANTFVSQLKGLAVEKVRTPVIGGHSGPTIVPLFSQVAKEFGVSLTKEETEALTHRVQYGGDEVVKAKDGGGSATLSMAYAAREFIRPFMASLNSQSECETLTCFVYDADKFSESYGYFAAPVRFSTNARPTIMDVPEMTEYERDLLTLGMPELKQNVHKGIEFAKRQK